MYIYTYVCALSLPEFFIAHLGYVHKPPPLMGGTPTIEGGGRTHIVYDVILLMVTVENTWHV